jgi:hypothetical protein
VTWQGWTVIGLGAALLVGSIKTVDLSGKLALEQSAHKQTQEALTRETEKALQWMVVYEDMQERALAQAAATQTCLDREAAARKAQEERRKILQAAQPRARTAAEQKQVVNDETRKSAADRLNRPW